MKLFLATLTAAVLATSAYAGQIKDKRFLTGAPDISSDCKGAFDESDEAFRACHRPYVAMQYGQISYSLGCGVYNEWKNLPARKTELAERDQQLNSPLRTLIGPEREKLDEDKQSFQEDERRLSAYNSLPTEDTTMLEFVCNNRPKWISDTLDNELRYIKRLAN